MSFGFDSSSAEASNTATLISAALAAQALSAYAKGSWISVLP
jgi:hypothetical protein